MLSEILSREDCASCRACCIFDGYTPADTPTIPDELLEKIKELRPEACFHHHNGKRYFRLLSPDCEGGCRCPMLGERGCMLGDSKPFECAIWPLRVCEAHGSRLIALVPLCDTINRVAPERLIELCAELAPMLLDYTAKHPEAISDFSESYRVLYRESE